jgi:tetratricopeptide (TPR) repeat protein
MRSPLDATLHDSLARELAVREGIKAYVTGSLAKVAAAYTVNLLLMAAESGEALVSIREAAADSSELIAAVDRATKRLRRRIGESLADLRQMPSIGQATTASLPAFRMFIEGTLLIRSDQRTLGIKRLEEAIALDTGFASAWVSLGMAYASVGNIGGALAAGEHAVANQGRLPYLERSFLLGSHAHAREEFRTAIEVYTATLARYPDNVPAMNNLALAYQAVRQFATAESLFRRGTTYDSTIPNLYFGIHESQLLQGKFADARRTLALIAGRFPKDPLVLTEEVKDAAAHHDWDRAERHAHAAIAAAGTDTFQLLDPVEALAGLAMTRGRVAEAERRWRAQLATSGAAGAMGRHLFGVIQLGYLELRYRSSAERAVGVVDSALAALSLERLLPGDRKYDELARFYAAAAKLRRARAMLEAAIANDRGLGRDLKAERSWTRGVLALAEGRAAVAVSELHVAAELHVCEICPLPALGRALEAAGRPSDAAVAYQRYLTTPWLSRYEPDAVELGWTTKRLAELQERLGDRRAAAATYSRLLALWEGSDPSLRPMLDDVRARLPTLRERPTGTVNPGGGWRPVMSISRSGPRRSRAGLQAVGVPRRQLAQQSRTSSTRRFRARPSMVAFDSRGRLDP